MTTDQQTTRLIVTRLGAEEYRLLEQQVGNYVVTDKTTEISAGYQLGVQHVLKIVCDGFVTGRV